MITAKTKVFGIIGNPVEHSKSPVMHSEFANLTDEDLVYMAFPVKEGDLKAAVDGLRALGICGINVTAPYKNDVIEFLDEVSEDAKKANSVNTVVNENGKLKGYTTDAEGLYRSIAKEGFDVKDKDILIFGAGGVVKPILIEFIKRGAKSIAVLNRTKSKAEALKEEFEIDTEIIKAHYDIVINTTSAGMHPQENVMPYEDISFVDKDTLCVDLIYNPEETLFLKAAKEMGARILNGRGMLICQGIIAYELFTGKKLPENAYEEALKVITE
ncbi:MAG: shikimate dehydrogenase [Clostridia bacterium]|nr:shikimate dehydrogenase [Clostridia bacterium]